MNERNLASSVVAEVKKAIVGKDPILVKVLAAILARGHILLEDIPGVGKTTLALAFAKALDLHGIPPILPGAVYAGYNAFRCNRVLYLS